MYTIGIDIGSSSIKAALVEMGTQAVVAAVQAPEAEMPIAAPQADWAEQAPEEWWKYCVAAVHALLRESRVPPNRIAAIGLSYQMHGLVAIDAQGEVIRPAIIWCDSRAAAIGQAAYQALGETYCLTHLLNSPGNFTAAKLRWVQEHESSAFERIHRILLPGDYIAYRLTGEVATTRCGLSEAILWDFVREAPAYALLAHWSMPADLLPPLVPVFGFQGALCVLAAEALGLPPGIPLTYRAGDQPNNAFALNVLEPGEAAANAGTSGVVYGVVGERVADPQQRVNSFAHVNHRPEAPRIGVLLCLNGCGSLYRWLRQQLGPIATYAHMDTLATTAPPGTDGLCVLPFGNGAERLLGNINVGARLLRLDFNRHTPAHLCRAALEGIAFALTYGIQQMRRLGLPITALRAGHDNLFRSPLFAQTLSTAAGVPVELFRTSGAIGAAQGAAVGLEQTTPAENTGAIAAGRYEPDANAEPLAAAFERWRQALERTLAEPFHL